MLKLFPSLPVVVEVVTAEEEEERESPANDGPEDLAEGRGVVEPEEAVGVSAPSSTKRRAPWVSIIACEARHISTGEVLARSGKEK